MGPQTYNPSPNMPSRPNNGYGAPQTANYYNPYYANPNFNQQVPIISQEELYLLKKIFVRTRFLWTEALRFFLRPIDLAFM